MMAASQTARRVQAVFDGTSLLVRRCTILPGGPDHAVGRCNCQTWSQICCIYLSKVNMAAALVLYRPLAETFFVPKASTLPHVIVLLISTF